MDNTTHPAKHTDAAPPDKTTTHTWGAFLKRARRSRGMSQRALARELGVSQARIAQIENGASTPQIDTMAAYITALGGELTVRADFHDHVTQTTWPEQHPTES
ncbi:helix-turn-helix transcriptional regulator [Streptomyces sp. DSM 41524]|uniref:Helix-turn-helix transcriptional regulator n=1 Tax=Streptomyces asiaticus subsp. ignotus TaxID=3098222 RepID=A0ABU7QC12_9ACTN|nr:helix-turn-helix transcriptional regulator [Streptomyces sp. DSM 41524]